MRRIQLFFLNVLKRARYIIDEQGIPYVVPHCSKPASKKDRPRANGRMKAT